MILHPSPLDATRFSINGKERMMVAEHSDFARAGTSLDSQLYDDACDVGIALRNPDTGNTTRWFMHEEKVDNEGELIATIYQPCPETLRQHSRLRGWTVHILND